MTKRAKTTAASTAGSFAPDVKAEPSVSIAPDWGDLPNVKAGCRTPWGNADVVTECAAGIKFASCPGHGGFKLSPQRNAVIPVPLRQSSGWYEEDGESHIVAMYFPEAYPGHDPVEVRQDAVKGVKDSFPHEYVQATGELVAVEESWTLQREASLRSDQQWRKYHAHNFVFHERRRDLNVKGFTVCSGVKPSTGETRTFLVPESAMVGDPRRVVFDRFLDITDEANVGDEPAMEPIHDLGIKFDHLTVAQRERAQQELRLRHRWSDGTVSSLADRMTAQGVLGKEFAQFSGETATTYFVCLPGSLIQPVSKASWDALAGVPNVMSDVKLASHEYRKARAKLDKATDEQRYSRGNSGADERFRLAKAAFDRAEELLMLTRQAEDHRQADLARQRTAAIMTRLSDFD